MILFSLAGYSEVNINATICTVDALISGTCGVLTNNYVYTQQYSTRSVTITAPYASTDNATSFTPDYGWHEGQNILTWTTSTLLPGNIKKNKVIMGVTGTLDNSIFPDCTFPQVTADLTSPNSTSECYVPSGANYVYSSYFGGRQNNCTMTQVDATTYQIQNPTDATKPKGACWIDTTSADPSVFPAALKTGANPNFVIKNTPASNTCPQSGPTIGLQASSCTTPDRTVFNGFYYPAGFYTNINNVSTWVSGQFGGRARNCAMAANNQPCWIADPTAFVVNDTACTEKVPDGSTDGAGSPLADLGTPLNGFSCKTSAVTNSIKTNNNTTTNALGRFVYTTVRGGRNTDCTQSSKNGNCYVNVENKYDLEPDLVPANIKKGIVILGVRGTLDLAEITYGSGAHRQPSGTASPNRIAYKETGLGESNLLESSNASASAVYPASYNPIPKIVSNSDADVVKVNRTTWSNTECGLTGTILARITNCATVFGATAAKWKGTVVGNSGQTNWDLVTRKRDSTTPTTTYEVWMDSATGLMWSSLVSPNLNWCKASGSNGRQITVQGVLTYDTATSSEDDPNNYCDQTTYQDQTTPISACAMDNDGGTGIFAFSTLYNSSTTPGKAGLLPTLTAATGRTFWRLPSIYDYILANHHGLRFVMPDIGVTSDEEWTATTYSANRKNAWTFSGKTGSRQMKQRNNPAAIRCIGR